MKDVRNTGFVVSLALLASLVCHVAIHRHFERRATASVRLANPVELYVANDSALIPPPDLSDIKMPPMPRFMEGSGVGRRIVPAMGEQIDEPSEHPPLDHSPPIAVPAPTDALPVEPGSRHGKSSDNGDTMRVRDVIEHELSHATPEEREIWFEELKSLPPSVVAELLQVRKQLRAMPRLHGGIPERIASVDPTVPSRSHEIAAEPASQHIRFSLPDHHSASGSLEAAISQMRHNLLNGATPGFKRLRVTMVDAYGPGWPETTAGDDSRSDSSVRNGIQGEGCRVAPLLLDLKQGTLKKTGRQLDLAIDGDGFFLVRRGEKDFLTRCGAFILDHDRTLCLAVANETVVLQPAMRIPDDAREIQVSAEGTVTILKSGETTLTEIGRVQLAHVASPSRLQPAGETLYVANAESGVFVLGVAMGKGLGEIQQGCLEQSNVDFEREVDEIEQLTMILKALPRPDSRPATAKRLEQSPTR